LLQNHFSKRAKTNVIKQYYHKQAKNKLAGLKKHATINHETFAIVINDFFLYSKPWLIRIRFDRRFFYHSRRSLVIVSTLVLHLKGAESFLGTSQSALKNTTAWKCRKIRWEKSRFYPVLAKIRIIKKNG